MNRVVEAEEVEIAPFGGRPRARSALTEAVTCQQPKAVRLLLLWGADPE